MKKLLLTVFKFAAAVYALLFAVFYFDLDGKFMYYIWEPLICRHYDRMKRKDNTMTPYEMKTDEAL